MSIFKNTLKQNIQDQLKARQDALVERTPAAIQYYNARNAWIRMSSAVDVASSPGSTPTNELASKHILQGGTLNNNQLRSGIGTGNQAYSTVSPGGVPNRLGIRPMPGITGVEVKSLGAYGSLRQVTVNFVAWDIRQLEDLELLYMRPGYTVLIEWGWAPYLTNDKKLSNIVDYYDIINQKPTKETIFKALYDQAVTKYNGNYDAMFGYVKNYSWKARPDGGYDCTTEVISIGEVMESLKVNYAPFDALNDIVNEGGLLASQENVTLETKKLKEIYSKNILAGLFYELFEIANKKMPGTKDNGENYILKDTAKNTEYHLFKKTINIKGGPGESNSDGDVGASDEQIYITLDSLCNLFNNHVIFTTSNGQKAFAKCSVLDREYDNSAAPNPLTGDGYNLCLAHPLQLSVDPTVCIIKNTVWPNGFKVRPETLIPDDLTDPNLITFNSKLPPERIDSILDQLYYIFIGAKTIKNKQTIADYLKLITQQDPDTVKTLTKRHFERLKDPNYKVVRPRFVELINQSKIEEDNNIDVNKLNKSLALSGIGGSVSLHTFLFNKGLSTQQLETAFGNAVEFTKSNPILAQQAELNKAKKDIESSQSKSIPGLQYLKNISRPYYYQNDWKTELGIIGNIYVNVNYLYRLALDNNLESTDTKEKKDINLYNFLKTILSEISAATGNVNNFDLFTDPINGDTVYIIDINYVDNKKQSQVYKDIFPLEIHNLKSTVRSYSLESQIFPDQSSVVAIGAQVGGGAMATDNNTMLDFNKGLEDRIIGKKQDPTIDPNKPDIDQIKNQAQNISDALKSLYDYFGEQSFSKLVDADFDVDEAADYKNSLKDLINFFKNITKSNIKNRAIIPTKLSVTMDGIGGLVIGHLFKIPEDLMPRGYKGLAGVGSKLGYTITGIGHSIRDNDWITNIDAQTIILDEPQGSKSFADIVEVNSATGQTTTKDADKISNPVSPNQNFRVNPTYKSLITAAKQSIGFSTAQINGTQRGNVGCAAAVSVIFLRATGLQIIPGRDIELGTSTLYEYFLKDTKNWKKRNDWRQAKPGDIIITSRRPPAGHVGVVIDTNNRDGSLNIISNSSLGFDGSDSGTIQQNYSIKKWESVALRNPLQTAAFEYIGSYI